MSPQLGNLPKTCRSRLFLFDNIRLPWLVGIGLPCAIVTIAPRLGVSKSVEDGVRTENRIRGDVKGRLW